MTEPSPSTIPVLRGPVSLSHLLLHSFVRDGHSAVDPTCGNGNDTLLLARLAGVRGHVWGFHVQRQAIEETGSLLAEAGLSSRVTLLPVGHEELAQHVAVPLQAVLFNLGYLPGGDRGIITRPDTTGIALEQSLGLLSAGGVVIVTVYPGHVGGSEEQHSVEKWAAGLDSRAFHSWRMGQTNVTTAAPYLLLVQKAL
jgi:hypothetical protein